MKLIKLSKGYFAKVDDESYDYLNQWKWHYQPMISQGRAIGGYAQRWTYIRHPVDREYIKKVAVHMHRLVLNAPDDLIVDHINGDGVDNQKANLRLATTLQNCRNTKKAHNKSSIHKGVSWNKQHQRWRARLEQKDLGFFKNEHLAALFYDFWATFRYGEFAKTNFQIIKQTNQ